MIFFSGRTKTSVGVNLPERLGRPNEMVESVSPWLPYMIGFVGAYLNIVAYGFHFGLNNHEFELPLVNLLRNPSLYPNDAIREGLLRLPTLFWPIVAQLSRWLSTEQVLFIFFVLTKIVFFVAVARLGTRMVKDYRLVACIILAIAFSPFLERPTPFGHSNILDYIQTHTSLAVAMILWVGVFLIEEHWMSAIVICGLATYISSLVVVYTLFALLVFAFLDWRRRKGQILAGALLGAVITIPAFALWHDRLSTAVPKGFVQALLMLSPGHLTLRSHPAHQLIYGTGLLAAAVLMPFIARKAGLCRELRLEVLALSYLIPVVLGAFFGEFLLTPGFARLQLLRADSFLVLYAVLLIQVYGANLLLGEEEVRPRATLLLGSLAILLPISRSPGLLWPLFVAMLLWADPKLRFEALWQHLAGSLGRSPATGIVLLACFVTAGRVALAWSSAGGVVILALVGGCLLAYGGSSAIVSARITQLAVALCCTAMVLVGIDEAPKPSNLWNPIIKPGQIATDWFDVQRWAKDHTPTDAQFLVPTRVGGFRMFSERSCWGEWKDGSVVYWFPPFADVYRQRMEALGPQWKSPANYKHQPWERLLSLALANHLDYIIQFRDVSYAVSPVFSNSTYAVYKVLQSNRN